MPGLVGKLLHLARTPQGQRALRTAARRAQEVAQDPATKAKAEQAVQGVRKRAGGVAQNLRDTRAAFREGAAGDEQS